jgi:hypothetical protein
MPEFPTEDDKEKLMAKIEEQRRKASEYFRSQLDAYTYEIEGIYRRHRLAKASIPLTDTVRMQMAVGAAVTLQLDNIGRTLSELLSRLPEKKDGQ